MNAKITETENKIPRISGLATNGALTTVKNKIPDVSILVTKTGYNTKISGIEKKITDHDHNGYITGSKFNKLTTESFKPRLAQADLVTKTDFDDKRQDLNKKITSNKTMHILVENELKNYKNLMEGKNYFVGNDSTLNYLVFQPMQKYF